MMVYTTKSIKLQFLKKFDAYPIDWTLLGVNADYCRSLDFVFSFLSKLRFSPFDPDSWVKVASKGFRWSIFPKVMKASCKTPKS